MENKKNKKEEAKIKKKKSYLDTMAHIVQHSVVNGLPDVPDRSLHIGRCYNLMGPRCVLVRGQDPDLPPGHLLFVDVHSL